MNEQFVHKSFLACIFFFFLFFFFFFFFCKAIMAPRVVLIGWCMVGAEIVTSFSVIYSRIFYF